MSDDMSATCSAKENREVPNYTTAWLMFFKRFIDDIFCIWLMDPDPVYDQENLETFKAVIRGVHPKNEHFYMIMNG
jgi:hypothetical protein